MNFTKEYPIQSNSNKIKILLIVTFNKHVLELYICFDLYPKMRAFARSNTKKDFIISSANRTSINDLNCDSSLCLCIIHRSITQILM